MSFIQIIIAVLLTFFGGKPTEMQQKPDYQQMNMPNSVNIDIVDIDRKSKDEFYLQR
jgi:hypothetical protein